MVKNMIINKRKLKLLHQLKSDLYEQALNNKDFEGVKGIAVFNPWQ